MVLRSLPAVYFGPDYSGGNEDNGDLPQKIPGLYCYSQCSQLFSRPPPAHTFTGDSWTPTSKSPVGSLFLSPESWCTRFCCVLQESISYNFPKFEFRIKPCFHQRYSEGSNKPCVHQGPRDHTESERRLRRYRVSTGLPQGQEIWVQQTWVWHKPSWRRTPLTPP